jgi:hypothetical protein
MSIELLSESVRIARALSRPPEDEMEVEGCSTRMVEVLEGDRGGAGHGWGGSEGAGRCRRARACRVVCRVSCCGARHVLEVVYWS